MTISFIRWVLYFILMASYRYDAVTKKAKGIAATAIEVQQGVY